MVTVPKVNRFPNSGFHVGIGKLISPGTFLPRNNDFPAMYTSYQVSHRFFTRANVHNRLSSGYIKEEIITLSDAILYFLI